MSLTTLEKEIIMELEMSHKIHLKRKDILAWRSGKANLIENAEKEDQVYLSKMGITVCFPKSFSKD